MADLFPNFGDETDAGSFDFLEDGGEPSIPLPPLLDNAFLVEDEVFDALAPDASINVDEAQHYTANTSDQCMLSTEQQELQPVSPVSVHEQREALSTSANSDAQLSRNSTPSGCASAVRSLSSNVSSITDAEQPQLNAVARARKAAEDFAHSKVVERKRKLGKDDNNNSAKRLKGGDGNSECTDIDNEQNPEKISHIKYQKRLQKNRDSAFVSRIRRREYTRVLEESLEKTEQEKEQAMSSYQELKRKYDIVCAELNALKEATSKRFAEMTKAIAKPVGAAAQGMSSSKTAVVTTMFMVAIMFGVMLPDTRAQVSSSNGGQPSFDVSGWDSELLFANNAGYLSTYDTLNSDNFSSRQGRVWNSAGLKFESPDLQFVDMPRKRAPRRRLENKTLINRLSRNATEILGEESAKKVVELVQSKVKNGSLSHSDLAEVTGNAEVVMREINERDEVKDRGITTSSAFQAMLNKLSKTADDRFMAELMTLLTMQLIPLDSKRRVS